MFGFAATLAADLPVFVGSFSVSFLIQDLQVHGKADISGYIRPKLQSWAFLAFHYVNMLNKLVGSGKLRELCVYDHVY